MAEFTKFGLDPEGDLAKRIARQQMERCRFYPDAPPAPSKLGGLSAPYCPMMTGFIGVPVSESSIIMGQKQVQVQVQKTQFPCPRAECLWWDRHLNRCGVTSLLEYMAGVEEDEGEDEAEEGEEQAQGEAPAGGEVPPQSESGAVV